MSDFINYILEIDSFESLSDKVQELDSKLFDLNAEIKIFRTTTNQLLQNKGIPFRLRGFGVAAKEFPSVEHYFKKSKKAYRLYWVNKYSGEKTAFYKLSEMLAYLHDEKADFESIWLLQGLYFHSAKLYEAQVRLVAEIKSFAQLAEERQKLLMVPMKPDYIDLL